MVLSANQWKEQRSTSGFRGFDRVILEFCCEVDSIIGKEVDDGCIAVRFTKHDDLTTATAIQALHEIVDDCKKLNLRVLLWSAIPCTGGCPFQEMNWLKGEATQAKIEGHWKLYRKLWSSFKRCSDKVLSQGGLGCY